MRPPNPLRPLPCSAVRRNDRGPVAEQRPGAALEPLGLERGDAPGPDVLPPGPRPAHRATRELLNRLTEDLTILVQTPEGRWSKRSHNAFVDALKRLDYVRPFEETL